MAYGKPSNVRSNFGQYQRYATANIKKQLRKTANELQVNVGKIIQEELERSYKKNVELSYGTRAPQPKIPYTHTGIFLDSIHSEIEHEPGIGRDRVKIVFEDDRQYPKRVNAKRRKRS